MKKKSKKKVISKVKETKIFVDLACGDAKQQGYIGVDIVKLPGVDIVHDLEKFPWPFKDESVDEVFCSHYVEHTKDLMKFMDELYRILKPEGKANIVAPYYSSMRAWQDPSHTRAISEATFLYFNKNWRVANKLGHYPITCDFDFSYGYAVDPSWVTRNEEARAFAIKHYINVITDIQVMLTKRLVEI